MKFVPLPTAHCHHVAVHKVIACAAGKSRRNSTTGVSRSVIRRSSCHAIGYRVVFGSTKGMSIGSRKKGLLLALCVRNFGPVASTTFSQVRVAKSNSIPFQNGCIGAQPMKALQTWSVLSSQRPLCWLPRTNVCAANRESSGFRQIKSRSTNTPPRRLRMR